MTRLAAALRRAVRRWLHAMQPGRGESDLARELQAHLTLLEDDFRRRGLSSHEARLAARRALGGMEQTKELHRHARSFAWIDDARRDAWQMLRSLNRHRGFAAVVILTLGIGIGANTALFSAFNAVVLKALPYRDPGQLVVIAPDPIGLTTGATFAAWRRHATRISAFAGFNGPGAATLNDRGTPVAIDFADITWNLLSFLGTPPMYGRDSTEADSQPGAPRVAILNYEFWQRRFGGDRSVIGRSMVIDAQPVTVIGITAPSFRFPVTGLRPATGVAETLQPGVLRIAPATALTNVLGRLAPGATPTLASAELLPIYRDTAMAPYTQALRDRAAVAVVPLHDRLAANLRQWLLLMMGTVAIVLIIASANVANLLLARASTRRREFAVRAAVGARVGRLVRLVFTESLLLAAVSAVLALLLAWWAGAAARPLLADRMPHVSQIGIDWTVFTFNVAVATATGLLCGVGSLAAVWRLDVATAFTDGGTQAMSGRTGLKRMLLLAEVSLSFVLVLGAVLLAQTFRNLQTKDRGFEARNVMAVRVTPSGATVKGMRDLKAAAAIIARYTDELRNRITATPGFESAAAVTTAPLTGFGPFFGDIAVEGLAPPEIRNASGLFVSAGYFHTLRTPLVAGREFTNRDTSASDSVVVVNQAFERRFAPGRSLIGARITASDRAMTVIGVAHDVAARTLRDPVEPLVFIPFTQSDRTPFFWAQFTLVARAAGIAPAEAATAIRRAIWSADPDAVVADVSTLEERVADSLRTERQSAMIFTALAAIALLIAAIGVYGVATYAIALRTRELGIRVALGAGRREIVRIVLGQSLLPAIGGIAAGVPLAFAAARLLTSMLYGVTALDIPSFVAAAAVLTIAALVATIAPTRRVLRLDPLEALRTD